jgi:uncharacterized protein (DUF1499 family)
MQRLIQSGFFLGCSLILTLFCWLGSAAPVAAQTSPSTVIAMANKPLFSFSGKRPDNLGVKDGKLAACPGTPNCVSSQATDAEHKIDAIAYTGSASDAIARLKSVIQGMERAEIITESSNYIYAEFTSALMGYVDDVEFYVDGGMIQVRSASRLGQSDLGVNRKRVEDIRGKLSA